ncbi:MAG: hypothetical protein K2P94_14360 [Rhodospirillaceae bacterium]|nr:hypothetical protein [Rhodospirillaceae bacterium]
MAKSEYVLNIGDDNVVLTRFIDGKVANAWLGSPDPAMAQEELGEALAEDPKGRISVLVDTLDQSFKEEEIPKVSILDRRKVLARHINMAFPGANMRGARIIKETDKKTLLYEFASVPLDGRIPGWMDFVASLPNEKGGIHSIAPENVDIIRALAPNDSPETEEGANHWRHLIGVNVTGGLRQIIEKNGRLSLTRLTQAPPADTPPDEFADMILRDFKATITYIRRLGYQVGEALDLVVLTTPENKAVLQDMDWDSARSVSVYTPFEAGAMLGLGSLGKEDQAYSDVLHAAWFISKRKSILPLTRAAALGDTKDDIRELAYAAAPYAAGLLVALTLGWTGWTTYELIDANSKNADLQRQLTQLKTSLSQAQADLGALPYEVARVRNVIDVATTLDAGKVDLVPLLQGLSSALETDAVILDFKFTKAQNSPAGARAPGAKGSIVYTVDIQTRLASVISTADEAVRTARKVEQRLKDSLGKDYAVTMTVEPVGAQAQKQLSGGFGEGSSEVATSTTVVFKETFTAGYRIERVGL